jgi:hypothetical protein
LFLFSTGNTFAQTYILYTDSHCANRGLELGFKCKQSGSATSPSKITISKVGKDKWTGKERAESFPLYLIKEDADVLILDYPVLYSGFAHIVLMKQTGRFYFTEVAYSSVLEVQSYDVEAGKFELKD